MLRSTYSRLPFSYFLTPGQSRAGAVILATFRGFTKVIRKTTFKRTVLASALLGVMSAPAAFAQDATAKTGSAAAERATNLDKVTVTGSRIKRADVEGPTPVVVLTAADIEKEGFNTVYEALTTLSQITGDVQNELTQSGFTPNAQFLNMRGMGPGYTLILINGKRMADYPQPYNSRSNAVSLSSIPGAAVERIEVLTGGASAIYGSDAVAGVVNIITKSNYDGNAVKIRAGTSTRGGGDTGLFQFTGGKSGDNWSVTYAAEYLNREEIQASQRDFMDSYYDNPDFKGRPDFATATSGVYLYRNTGAQYVWKGNDGSINNSVKNLREACAATSSEFTPYNSSASVSNSTPNRCGYFGYPATQSVQNSFDKLSGYVAGTYDFSNGLQAYAQALVTDSTNKGYSSTQFWQTPGYVYDPTLGYVQAQRIFTPEEVGGPQATVYDETSINVVGGVRGIIADRFDWDASVSHSRFDYDTTRPRFLTNKINDYFLGPKLGMQGSYPIHKMNVDRLFSPLTPDIYNSLITNVRNSGSSKNTTGSFSISGDLFDLPAGPLGAALVVEAATQEYTLDPDIRSTVTYTGADKIYNLTATGGGGERDRYAMGLELSIPIFDSLKASLAGRFDKYDDVTNVDGAGTWSAGLEWRPFSSLLLRGNYSTSFRAPDMHYVFAGPSGSYSYIVDQLRCRQANLDPKSTACTGNTDYYYQVFSTRQGSRALEEETGKSFTVGFVWDIIDDLALTVDYYNIKLEGAVSDIDSDYLFRNEADCLLGKDINGNPVDGNSQACKYFTSLITRDNTDLGTNKVTEKLSVPFNQAMMRTSGIDASLDYKFDTDRWGRFSFGAKYTHVLKLEERDLPDSELHNARDDLQYFNYRSKVTLNSAWSKDDWSASVYGTRAGSLPNWAETGRVSPYFTWNLTVNKKITNKASVGIQVVNLFDKAGGNDDTFNSYPYFWRAYSAVGRQISAELNYKF